MQEEGGRKRREARRGGREGRAREGASARPLSRQDTKRERTGRRTLLDAEDVADKRAQRQPLEPLPLDLVAVLVLALVLLALALVLARARRPLGVARADVERRLGRRDLGVAVGAEPGQGRVDDRRLDGRDSAQLVVALVARLADDELLRCAEGGREEDGRRERGRARGDESETGARGRGKDDEGEDARGSRAASDLGGTPRTSAWATASE